MNFTSLTNDVKEYIQTQIDILKLKAVSKIEKIIANAILAVALCFLGVFSLLFFSLAAALSISTHWNMPFLGFLIVGCFYLLLAVLLFALRQRILHAPIINSLLKKVGYHNNNKE